MKITTVGIDLAKTVLQVHGVTEHDKKAFNKQLRPKQVLSFFTQLHPCLIGLEACGGAHHWERGKPSNRSYPDYFKQYVLDIIKTYYLDFGPTLAAEKLSEKHDISLAIETFRVWIRDAGIWTTHREKRKQVHQPHYRRDCMGELIQVDGSDHDWFEGRCDKCTLLVYIDDATSQLMHLKFVESENTFDYFRATTEYLEQHGKPVAFLQR